ncbi:MAG TPA: hypothetical protein VGT05_02830 [Patescibacteria group bacterium]|nr:hypothetical protein [Patescibacteria group bacterium]
MTSQVKESLAKIGNSVDEIVTYRQYVQYETGPFYIKNIPDFLTSRTGGILRDQYYSAGFITAFSAPKESHWMRDIFTNGAMREMFFSSDASETIVVLYSLPTSGKQTIANEAVVLFTKRGTRCEIRKQTPSSFHVSYAEDGTITSSVVNSTHFIREPQLDIARLTSRNRPRKEAVDPQYLTKLSEYLRNATKEQIAFLRNYIHMRLMDPSKNYLPFNRQFSLLSLNNAETLWIETGQDINELLTKLTQSQEDAKKLQQAGFTSLFIARRVDHSGGSLQSSLKSLVTEKNLYDTAESLLAHLHNCNGGTISSTAIVSPESSDVDFSMHSGRWLQQRDGKWVAQNGESVAVTDLYNPVTYTFRISDDVIIVIEKTTLNKHEELIKTYTIPRRISPRLLEAATTLDYDVTHITAEELTGVEETIQTNVT